MADEIVQLYVSRDIPGAPIRALAGFQRVHLKAGEARDVRLALDPRSMSVVDAAGRRSIMPGIVDLWIGGGQPDAARNPPGATAELRVTGTRDLPN